MVVLCTWLPCCRCCLLYTIPRCPQVKEIVEKGTSSRVAAAEADEQLQVLGGLRRVWLIWVKVKHQAAQSVTCPYMAAAPMLLISSRSPTFSPGHVNVHGDLGHWPRHRRQVVRTTGWPAATMYQCGSFHGA